MSDALGIRLTQGAIDNGYLASPSLKDFIPAQYQENDEGVSPESLVLELPDGSERQTCLLLKYNRIQARLGALFTAQGLQEGDEAILMKDSGAPGRFHLSFQKMTRKMTDAEIEALLPDYTNATVLEFFQSLPDEACQRWHVEFLLKARKAMPLVDHYSTAWGSKITICLGVRHPEKTSGTPFLRLRADGSFYRDFQRYSTTNAGNWIKVFSEEKSELASVVDAWISHYSEKLNNEAKRLRGQGRAPRDYVKAAEDEADESDMHLQLLTPVVPQNQILFGPPGTGKTYATIEAALAVLDAGFLSVNREDRAVLKARFDELAAAGQVRFVTFHQSFSYEDFVEGLRAENTEDGSLRYVVADGVFKSLCEAAAARVTQQADAPIDLSGRRIWKMSLGNSLGSDAYIYDECIEKGYALLGYGGTTDFAGCKTRDEVYQRFLAAGDDVARDSYAVTSVTTFVQKIRKGDLLVVTEGNTKFRAIGEITGDYASIERDETGDDYGQCRPVKWLRVYSPSLPHDQLMNNQFSQMTLYELKPGAMDMAKLAALLRVQTSDAQGVRQPRVLIIDEINRGNVSRIFGELITLIEPSKRAGATEALEVILPYSKQPFSVPDNVYLIGTMNTADRSLAGLDIALRRRFVFREMPARPELLDAVTVEGIAIGELLRVMNARIEVLLDRDHCLGHAYFMPLAAPGGNTLEALAMIFRQQILPLLQEYFFEDWQRIQWVLNDHRKAPENCFVCQASRDAQSLFGEGVNVAAHNLPWAITEDAFDRTEAYLGIINHELVVAGAQPLREVSYPPYVIRQLPTGTIEVSRSGQAQLPVISVLREIAGQLNISHWHDNGTQLNNRQLGRRLIAVIEANA